ncbi:2,3-bisphosphoglycerate-dependent phosphoglycerate mutase [Patescibacteria group bacterium]
MSKLILLRHLQSKWNLENRFTGWVDIPLSKNGVDSAGQVAKKLSEEKIDVVYTSPLVRNKDTASLILKNLGEKVVFINPGEKISSKEDSLPIFVSPALNERNYGELQGLDKDEMKKKYGEEQIHQWRRGFDQTPPKGESLKDVLKRVLLLYQNCIEEDLKEGKNVLVVASHNSLRALVKHIEQISEQDIINLEIPTATVIKYEFEWPKLKDKKVI